MRNVNAAIFVALYAAMNAFMVFSYPGPNVPLVFILTLPLLWLASRFSGKERPAGRRTFAPKSPASLFPYILMFHFIMLFTLFVYRKVTGSVVTFYDPIMTGWTLYEGFLLLCLSIGAASCALVIWSSAHYNRNIESGALDRLWIGEIFLAGRGELIRFALYFTVLLFVWALSVEAMRPLVGSWPFVYLVISMGRTMMPLMLLLIAAIIRLPMSVTAVLAAGGVYLMAGAVVGYWQAGIFVLVQIVPLAAVIVARYIEVGLLLPPVKIEIADKEKKENSETT